MAAKSIKYNNDNSLIAPYGMVYRNKMDYDVWAKYITLSENDSPDNWELVTEEVAEKKGK